MPKIDLKYILIDTALTQHKIIIKMVIYMTQSQILQTACEYGFLAKIIPTQDIEVNYDFRRYCEENLCGKYGMNYSCPPDCGTPEQMYKRLTSKSNALVLQLVCDIDGYDNKQNIQNKKNKLNTMVAELSRELKLNELEVIPLGYGGCTFCSPCMRAQGKPCAFPQDKISCISAYCIDAAKLAQKGGFEFEWNEKRLYLFGMILFD